jgi:ligand-binding SRPBCC domain-containing protein
MTRNIFTTTTHLPLPRAQVFPFFADAANLGVITPPELAFRILTPQPITIAEGTRIDYQLGLFGIPMHWQTIITRWQPPYEFVDLQAKGPYKFWEHTHRFFEDEQGTIMEDIVRYELPFWLLGDMVHPLVRLQLNHIFRFREQAVRQHLPG